MPDTPARGTLEIRTIRSETDFPDFTSADRFTARLYHFMGKYGDPEPDMRRAVDYALSSSPGKGGFLLVAVDSGTMVGGLVMNDTGMGGYVPEHLLVYIGVSPDARGNGIGGRLLEHACENCQGDIALHVDPDSPAQRLYRRAGFTDPYIEMRLAND